MEIWTQPSQQLVQHFPLSYTGYQQREKKSPINAWMEYEISLEVEAHACVGQIFISLRIYVLPSPNEVRLQGAMPKSEEIKTHNKTKNR